MEEIEETAQILLERVHRHLIYRFPVSLLDKARLDCRIDSLAQDVVIELDTALWAENAGEEKKSIAFLYPMTWWDHFILDKFPAWLKKHFPPRIRCLTKEVTITKRAVFPKFFLATSQPYVAFNEIRTKDLSDVEIN